MDLIGEFVKKTTRRFPETIDAREYHRYRTQPQEFARQVLGSQWWSAQAKVAKSLSTHRRVAVKSELARYKHPRRLIIGTELPKTALGKVQKDVLIRQITARADTAAAPSANSPRSL